ncbi:MAG: hypothetical protein PUC47_11585 [Oscillospiraceae bacterium]|nr:hypothetical protein [Oscillospiraceae bacterium]
MEVKTYQCPRCGAPLTFSSDSQRWDCEYCLSSFSLEELDDVPPEPEKPAEDTREEELPGSERLRAYVCPQCGAEIVTDDTTAATFCVFCQNPAILTRQLQGEFRPDLVIPFRTKKEDAVAAYLKLCHRKPLVPRSFMSPDRLEKITGVYVPFWLYDCRANGQLAASAQQVTTWSDSKYRYTKTDHYHLVRSGRMQFRRVPADGSSKMDDAMMDSIEPYDYSALEPFSTAYLSGYLAERYDVDDHACYSRVEERMKATCEAELRSTMTGFASVQVNRRNFDLNTRKASYALLPVWLLVSTYGGKEYHFAMNGQTGKLIGTLPVSVKRAVGWFFVLLGGLTALLYLGGMLF